MTFSNRILSDNNHLYYSVSEPCTDKESGNTYTLLLDDAGQTVVHKAHSPTGQSSFIRKGLVNSLNRQPLQLKISDYSPKKLKFNFAERAGRIEVMPAMEAAGKPGQWKSHWRREGLQFHHIIPQSLKGHNALRLAGFDIDNVFNQILLPEHKDYHATRQVYWGNHSEAYNRHIRNGLNDILGEGTFGNWTQQQYKDAVRKFLAGERKALKDSIRVLNRNYRDVPDAQDPPRVQDNRRGRGDGDARRRDHGRVYGSGPSNSGGGNGGPSGSGAPPPNVTQQQYRDTALHPTIQNFYATLRADGLEASYQNSNPTYQASGYGSEGSKNVEVNGGEISNFEKLYRNGTEMPKEYFIMLHDMSGVDAAFRSPFTSSELRQIVFELTRGIYLHDAVPFFSLHFNERGQQYPVVHPIYRNTYVGKIILELDYFMKSFLHGGQFTDASAWTRLMKKKADDRSAVFLWTEELKKARDILRHERKTLERREREITGDIRRGKSTLRDQQRRKDDHGAQATAQNLSNLTDLLKRLTDEYNQKVQRFNRKKEEIEKLHQPKTLSFTKSELRKYYSYQRFSAQDPDFRSLDRMKARASRDTGVDIGSHKIENKGEDGERLTMRYEASVRIHGKQNEILHYENMFILDPGYYVAHTVDWLPTLWQEISEYAVKHGKVHPGVEKLEEIFSMVDRSIEQDMGKFNPEIAKYLELLKTMNFLVYFLKSLKKAGYMPRPEVPKQAVDYEMPAELPPLPVDLEGKGIFRPLGGCGMVTRNKAAVEQAGYSDAYAAVQADYLPKLRRHKPAAPWEAETRDALGFFGCDVQAEEGAGKRLVFPIPVEPFKTAADYESWLMADPVRTEEIRHPFSQSPLGMDILLLASEDIPLVARDIAKLHKTAMRAMPEYARYAKEEPELEWNSSDGRGSKAVNLMAYGLEVLGESEKSDALRELSRKKLAEYVNARDAQGWSPLHWAVSHGNMTNTLELIKLGADIGAADRLGVNPLHLSLQSGQFDIAYLLLQKAASPAELLRRETHDGRTPLSIAAQKGIRSLIGKLIRSGASLSERSANGLTVQMVAAQNDLPLSFDLIKGDLEILLQARYSGETVLHMLAAKGDVLGLMMTLLHLDKLYGSSSVSARGNLSGDVNRSPFLADRHGVTPFHLAAEQGHTYAMDMVRQYLIERIPEHEDARDDRGTVGIRVDMRTANGETALMKTVAARHYHTAKLLIAVGADPAARTRTGSQITHKAAASNDVEGIEWAAAHGLDLTDGLPDGDPMSRACENGAAGAVMALQESGVTPTPEHLFAVLYADVPLARRASTVAVLLGGGIQWSVMPVERLNAELGKVFEIEEIEEMQPVRAVQLDFAGFMAGRFDLNDLSRTLQKLEMETTVRVTAKQESALSALLAGYVMSMKPSALLPLERLEDAAADLLKALLDAKGGWRPAFEASFKELIEEQSNRAARDEMGDLQKRVFALLGDRGRMLGDELSEVFTEIRLWCKEGNWPALQRLSRCRSQLAGIMNTLMRHDMKRALELGRENLAELRQALVDGASDEEIHHIFFNYAFMAVAGNTRGRDTNLVIEAAKRGRLPLVRLFKTFGAHLAYGSVRSDVWNEIHDNWQGTEEQRRELYQILLFNSPDPLPGKSLYEAMIVHGMSGALKSKVGAYFKRRFQGNRIDLLRAAFMSQDPDMLSWIQEQITTPVSCTMEEAAELLALARKTNYMKEVAWLYEQLPVLRPNAYVIDAFERKDKDLIKYWFALPVKYKALLNESLPALPHILENDRELGLQFLEAVAQNEDSVLLEMIQQDENHPDLQILVKEGVVQQKDLDRLRKGEWIG
jgi:ankyrin repeat protein